MDLSGASHWFSHCDRFPASTACNRRPQVFLYPQQSIVLRIEPVCLGISDTQTCILPCFSKKKKRRSFHYNNNSNKRRKKTHPSQDLANLITARRVGVTTESQLCHCQGGGGARWASAAERPRNQRNSTDLQFPEKAIRIAISPALSVIQPGMRSDFSPWKQEALLAFILKGEKEEIPINGGTRWGARREWGKLISMYLTLPVASIDLTYCREGGKKKQPKKKKRGVNGHLATGLLQTFSAISHCNKNKWMALRS